MSGEKFRCVRCQTEMICCGLIHPDKSALHMSWVAHRGAYLLDYAEMDPTGYLPCCCSCREVLTTEPVFGRIPQGAYRVWALFREPADLMEALL